MSMYMHPKLQLPSFFMVQFYVHPSETPTAIFFYGGSRSREGLEMSEYRVDLVAANNLLLNYEGGNGEGKPEFLVGSLYGWRVATLPEVVGSL